MAALSEVGDWREWQARVNTAMKLFFFMLVPVVIVGAAVGSSHHMEQSAAEALTGAVGVVTASSAAAVTGFKSRKPHPDWRNAFVYTVIRHKVDLETKAAWHKVS